MFRSVSILCSRSQLLFDHLPPWIWKVTSAHRSVHFKNVKFNPGHSSPEAMAGFLTFGERIFFWRWLWTRNAATDTSTKDFNYKYEELGMILAKQPNVLHSSLTLALSAISMLYYMLIMLFCSKLPIYPMFEIRELVLCTCPLTCQETHIQLYHNWTIWGIIVYHISYSIISYSYYILIESIIYHVQTSSCGTPTWKHALAACELRRSMSRKECAASVEQLLHLWIGRGICRTVYQ